MPNEHEQREVLAWAEKAVGEGHSAFPGMTFEEGVVAAMLWMRGETLDRPDAD